MLPKRSSMYPRGDSNLYSPECVEKEFSEVGQEFIGNSSLLASVGALATDLCGSI
jgi:hypothetical protein